MIKVGVVGSTGYTGIELIRILCAHPDASIHVLTSRAEEGRLVSEIYPVFRGYVDLVFSSPAVENLLECDVVFFATPHAVSMKMVQELYRYNIKIIDLSADFRLQDVRLWEKWYGTTHLAPELIDSAVYGLPELYRNEIRDAKLLACPGCYPTSVQLGLIPLLEADIIDCKQIIANVASGVSGAGKKADVGLLHTEIQGDYRAYAATGHRHSPEIIQTLSNVSGQPVTLTFMPHLVPMNRGIFSTLYVNKKKDVGIDELQSLYQKRYKDESFVDVMPKGVIPQTKSVSGTNTCRLSITEIESTQQIVVFSVIDNLTKGSSGQAVQCMNLMFGLEETTGLNKIGFLP